MSRVTVLFVLALLVLVLFGAGCGGGSGGSQSSLAPPGHSSVNSEGQIVVETEATPDYRSTLLGTGRWASSLVFTAFYRAWFTRVEYRPAPGWLCGRSADDFTKLIISREGGTGIKVILRLSFGGTSNSVDTPRWSPEGTRIALSDAGFRIVVCNADGTNPHSIMESGGFAKIDGLCWAPNGRIYFAWQHGGQTDIYSIDPDSTYSMPAKVTDDSDEDWCPDVSPDGRWLVWMRRETSLDDWDLYWMPLGGNPATDASVLVDTSENEQYPRWSPDGRYVAYIRGNQHVMVCDTFTGATRTLTDSGGAMERSCDWSADGRYVLFTRERDLYRIRPTGSPGDEELLRANWGTGLAARNSYQAIRRVLIGPDGSDYGGADPPFGAKRPGIIIVQSAERLVSAVSFLTASTDKATIVDRTPPETKDLVVCEIRAGHVRRIFEDNGPGIPRTVWVLETSSYVPGAALIVFNTTSGKVASVVALRDQVGSSAAAGPRVALEGGKLVIHGDALVVYDARGQRVTGPSPVARAVLDATTGEPVAGAS